MPSYSSKFKEAFLSEVRSHIKTMNLSLVELEKNPTNSDAFQGIFRAAHTLKSLSGTMKYDQTMNVCHEIEDILETIRNNKIPLNNCTNLLFECFDFLEENLKKIIADETELDSTELIKKIQELLLTGNVTSQNNTVSTTASLEKIQSIEVKVDRLDVLMNLVEELLVNKMKLDAIRDQIDNPELTPAVESLGRLITDMQYHIMQIRLVPIGFVFNRFARMVRDLAQQQKKEINLEIEGGDIELDRLLLDEISQSISHLIRNAVDHGIEIPEERKKLNKLPSGTIKLKASRSKESAVIEISDDGAGLDFQAIKMLGVKRHILKNEASIDEVSAVIFSGLSTTKDVTSISGRGLGLPIVKQKIESIGGTIKVKSVSGEKTSFFIEMPINLAIIKTLFVCVNKEIYAIPIEAVERLVVLSSNEFKSMMNFEAIIFEGMDIPIIHLATLFGTPPISSKKSPIVIIRKDNQRLGLVVDELLTTHDIVIKPLSRTVKENKYFSGAALSGSGQVILILDISYLLFRNF